jgi:hypothetical protein
MYKQLNVSQENINKLLNENGRQCGIYRNPEKIQTVILELKNSVNQTKNPVESHFSRLHHIEDRLSGLEDMVDILE